MGVVEIINLIISITLGVLFSYKFLFTIIGIFFRKKFPKAQNNHSYAVLIAGRNEENVIGQLIESIKLQNYDQNLIKIFVVADNCTDKTAKIAQDVLGGQGMVFERFNKTLVGKGYAIDFLLEKIKESVPDYIPDGFFVFDADNLLHKNYILEMNKAFDSGEKIITSYRAPKNFHTNWVSATSAMNFMRECRISHAPRALLKTSTHISGTGFLVSSEVLNTETGWKYTTLTEDIEFTCGNVLKGNRVTYCDDAIFYDEQPVTFKASWNQRLRWQKGFYQCFWGYFFALFFSIFSFRSFARYEMALFVFPFGPVIFFWKLFYLGYDFVLNLITPVIEPITATVAPGISAGLLSLASALITMFIAAYVLFFFIGMLILFTERKRVKTTFWQKLKCSMAYPFFMISWVPISIVALFKKVKWKQIPHVDSRKIEDIISENNTETVKNEKSA